MAGREHQPDTMHADAASAAALFAGAGDMRRRCRTFDWSGSALGPVTTWSESLKAAVALILAAPQPMWIGWGTDAIQLYNDACATLLDRAHHPAILGTPAAETWGDIWPLVAGDFNAALHGTAASYVDRKVSTSDREGKPRDRYFTYSYSPIPDAGTARGVGGVLCIVFETTSRVQAESALADAVRHRQAEDARHRTVRLLLETASQGIALVSAEETIVAANPALESMFGWPRGALSGQSVELLLPPLLGQRYREHRARYHSHTSAGMVRDQTGCRLDGTTFPVEVRLSHLVTDDGGQTLAVVTDITERVRAESAARESHRRLQLALDAAEAAAWSFDVRTQCVEADHRLYRRLDIGPDDPLTVDHFLTLVHADDRDRVRSIIDGVLASNGPSAWDFEHRLMHTDGSLTWLHSVARAERDAEGHCLRISGITLDITARKTAEEEVARSHDALRRRAAELEQRNQQLQRLATELTLTEQQAREHLAKTLHDGLQQLLFSARLRVAGALPPSGRGKEKSIRALTLATEDLDEAIAAARSLAVELFPPALHERGLPAALEWLADWTRKKYGLVVRVTADPAADPDRSDLRILLFESVRELLFNVVKHVGPTAEAVVDLTAEDDALCITVSDNGAGIDPRVAFGHPDTPHIGLGLFSIRERLSMLGGRLEAEAQPGVGTRLRIVAPLGWADIARERLTESRQTSRSDAHAREPEATVRVLIVDDHASVRKGLRAMLRDQDGIEVVGEAANGIEAIACTRALHPDAIVIDVSMPEMGGIEATRHIHAQWPAIHIFGFSTQESTEDLHAIEKAGAAGYFTKDADSERLVARLRAIRQTSRPA